MANTVIALKKSATPSATPSSLANGELAINYADGKLFYKAANGAIVEFSQGGASYGTVNANGTLIVAGTSGDVLTIIPGSGINIVGDAINDAITISSTGGGGGGGVVVSNTAPVSPSSGDLWWNSTYGKLFVYYIDGDSSQWVDTTSSVNINYYNTLVGITAFDQANAAYNQANNALANTSDVSFNGNLYFPSGNVGIGTTSPSSKLTVTGTIESTTGGIKFPDGSTQTTAASAGVTTGKAIAMAIVFG